MPGRPAGPISVEVGQRVRARREALGVTVEDFAARLGVDKGTLSRLERGSAAIDVDRLVGLAQELDVTPEAILRAARKAPKGKR